MANVYLDDNYLTRLESNLYLPILEKMANALTNLGSCGFFEVNGSIDRKLTLAFFL